MAEEGLPAAAQGEGGLELSADSQDRARALDGQLERPWGGAPGAALPGDG
jgi:hypothetical protein